MAQTPRPRKPKRSGDRPARPARVTRSGGRPTIRKAQPERSAERPERREGNRPQRPPRDISPRATATPPGQEHDEGDEQPELLYGRQSVLAALQGRRPLNRIWLTEKLRYDPRFLRLLDDAKAGGTVLDIVEPRRLDQLVVGGNHQGIIAQTAAHPYVEFEALLESLEGHTSPVLLAADGIEDPHNLGALIRSAEAFGFQGVIIPRRRAVGVTATVAKVAAGAVEHLPIARVTNLNQALERLKEVGYTVVGAQEKASAPLWGLRFDGPLVVVVGSEGKGIALLTQRHCDHLVSIPLAGRTSSLNASVAGGILLYEIQRQRGQRNIDLSGR